MTQEEIIQEEAIQKIKDRIAYHADETEYRYEIGKGVMDCLASDILIDLGVNELAADRDAWKARAERAEAELKEAVDFIHYLDKNYSCYLSIADNEKFTKWRGAREGAK